MSSRRIIALTDIYFDDEYDGDDGGSEYAAAKTVGNYLNRRKKQNQKRSIKKKYAAVRQRKTAAAQKAAVSQAKRLTVLRQKAKHSALTLILILLLAGFCLNCVNGCTMLLQGGLSALGGSTYPSKDEDMLRAEAVYAESERELQSYLDSYEQTHSYDEYHFELDEIGHDPYVLISLLTGSICWWKAWKWKFAPTLRAIITPGMCAMWNCITGIWRSRRLFCRRTGWNCTLCICALWATGRIYSI